MDNELKFIRKKIADYETKLINLINDRINLGIDVANIKYKYLENTIDFSSRNNIMKCITNDIVENNIYDRLKENIENENLANLIIQLYKEYIIPQTKELQINILLENHNNRSN
jgi:chorismate mutase